MPPRKRKASTKANPDPDPERSPAPDQTLTTEPPPIDTKDNSPETANTTSSTFTSFSVPLNNKSITCERRSPNSPTTPKSKSKSKSKSKANTTSPPALIFTHGAGGALSTPSALHFAEGFSTLSPIVSFQGSMNLKSRVNSFVAVIDHERWGEALGGRSMGARAAVMAASQHDQSSTKALVLVSYPLKSPKGDLRDQILLDVEESVDVLFIVGDRDEMCDLDDLERVRGEMKVRSWRVVVEGADHGMGMKPKQAEEEMRRLTAVIAAEWLRKRTEEGRECNIGWDEEKQELRRGEWTSGGRGGAVAKREEEVQDEEAEEGAGKKRKRRKRA